MPVKRDLGRDHHPEVARRSLFMEAIHKAVVLSAGVDAYISEQLDWHLISTYDSDESKLGRRGYKPKFALPPTVDHIDAGASEASFRVCAWRTNYAENNLGSAVFIELCRRVVAVADAQKT